jgi:ribosomal protein L37AE/L43A
MSIPESIPEDKIESYQCDECKIGSITKSEDGMFWQCDNCDFSAETNESLNK